MPAQRKLSIFDQDLLSSVKTEKKFPRPVADSVAITMFCLPTDDAAEEVNAIVSTGTDTPKHLNLVGPVKESKGYKHILTSIDRATRYKIA